MSNEGIEVNKAKVDMIDKLPPIFVKGVRSFLRHVDFYRWFINIFQKITKPLTKLLLKDMPFEFDEICLSAFHRLKEALNYALVIQAPDWRLPFKENVMLAILY